MKRRTATAALWALLLTGCTLSPPPEPPATTPGIQSPATTPGAQAPSVGPSPTQASPFAPIPMPAPAGGPMLWPSIMELQPGVHEDNRYGFINADPKRVRAADYWAYDYCIDESGNPQRVVALRPNNSVDVLSLDGSVTRTIPVPASPYDDYLDNVRCQNNQEVWVYSGDDTYISDGTAYNADTGRRIRSVSDDDIPWKPCSPDDISPDSDDDTEPELPDTPEPETAEPELPTGYATWLSEEWAIDEKESKALNVATSAVVDLPATQYASAFGPYLITSRNDIPLIYTRDGRLTSLGSLTPIAFNSACTGWPDDLPSYYMPFYWATSGRIQGYVDDWGIWHYQESIDRILGDD